ncbi:MAG: hypothetical protein A2W91_04000 [Bacteroidetes bacterium GWF2_38_335]|nr:MAG: hypothetical protein A2W91_04000 [Bacteroidetes bacterium GWF2_38_335]OFY79113.1 MAG: hypothetical protein A2281_03335 [Bacteroidetes bacterium RIFOXYA12_FULL_38_20]HBS88800.1 hypothetical protein [Bacteroidales bacterium]
MKTIIKYLRDFVRADFNPVVYGLFFLFLAVTIFINYYFKFEQNILTPLNFKPGIFFYNFLFFIFPYFAVAAIKFSIEKKYHYFKNSEFWVKSLLFMFLIGFAQGFYQYRELIPEKITQEEFVFTARLFVNIKRFIIFLIPIFIIKLIYDRQSGTGLYGIHFHKFNVKPYFLILLFVIPLIVWASFQPDFLRTYPTLKPWYANGSYGLTYFQAYGIYEFFYGMDFMMVEFMFRGALIIGMMKILGKDALLPMVAAYAFLHFGKPAAETISSVFGGYVLGVIAFRTKSIWGGCILHIGLAFAMEAAALMQYYNMGKIEGL